MKLVVVGLNHNSAPVEVRERVAVPSEEKPDICRALFESGAADEAVVVSTCNRTEFFLGAPDLDAAAGMGRAQFEQRCAGVQDRNIREFLYEARESDAVRHLFEVTTSLDSLVIGEPHIIGQIREDFGRAQQAGTAGKMLGRLFNTALELGKSVRTNTDIGESPVSISSIALDLAARVFGSIADHQLLILGAGEMSRQTAILAKHRGAENIRISSRTKEHAKQLAEQVDGMVFSWDDMWKAMVEADVVVTATGAHEPIIGYEQMARVMHERNNRPIFLIDIAVPRDVDVAVDSLYNIYRYDLDDLTGVARENEVRRKGSIPAVQKMIEQALTKFEKWNKEQTAVPAIVSLRERVEEIRRVELKEHLGKMHSLDERDRNLVEAMSVAIVNKVLHAPTVRLKEAAARGGDRPHISSLRFLFDLEGSAQANRGEDGDE